MDRTSNGHLYSHLSGARQHIVALGEILWDLFDYSERLGGAALNFGAHARRLGHTVTLISAVGTDSLGKRAAEMVASLDLDVSLLGTTALYPTGTARVQTTREGNAEFAIHRPAAYDAVRLSEDDLTRLTRIAPAWVYFGTLFASTVEGREVLERLLRALPDPLKFYDINLRPGFDSPDLVRELLARADVVKLNEEELHRIAVVAQLPRDIEAFCREASARYAWKAVGVTLGARGCAVLANGKFVEAAGYPVEVADTVGAGDAFAAAFLHGLSCGWPVARIAAFANRVGALVASRHGAIPDWTLEEAVLP